jgi:hypothetical protein
VEDGRNDAAIRLDLALDLFETGEAMMRAVLRRRRPGASAAAIEDELRAWLATRPGAEYGDGQGVPCSWPRVSR